MLGNRRYRLRRPIVAVQLHHGAQTQIALPGGALIELLAGVVEGARIVAAKCDGRFLMLLLKDIQQCAYPETVQ